MKATHVVATVDDPAAGPSYSVGRLCEALADQGIVIELHTVSGWRANGHAHLDVPVWRHPQTFAGAPLLGRLCASAALNRTLRRRITTTQVVHAHGLWLMPNVYPAWAMRDAAAAMILSPRGMLGGPALRFSQGKKALFWCLLQKRAVESAGCLHATSAGEYDDIRAFGLLNPVAIILNGVDAAPISKDPAEQGSRTVLTLGRIHPKKGLDDLVLAWAAAAADHPNWRLRIVGPSEMDHAQQLVALCRRLGLASVSVEDGLYGPDRAHAYRDADIFVLPSLNENFAMTVAEALAAGTPVIATWGAPWAGLREHRCGWWVDHGAGALEAALREAMATPPATLAAMGERGRGWMVRDFSWRRVASEMGAVYAWLSEGGAPPPTVRLD